MNPTLNIGKYRYTQSWFLGSEIRSLLPNYLPRDKAHRILEIGCYEGLSSVFFANNFLNHPDSRMDCVDPFMNIATNDHSEFLSNNEEKNFDYNISICSNSEKIYIHKVTSDEFFKSQEEMGIIKTYDFIYIDGCHLHDFIYRDMSNSFEVLEKNGIMWMDDYLGGNGTLEMKKAMDSFLETIQGKYALLHSGYQLAIVKL